MFHAVREWWSDGRIKRTLGLFAFEFAVIVAGVLVAQAAADYVNDRSERERMRNVWVVSRRQVAAAGFVALGWNRAALCIDERMNEILRSAALGREVAASQLERPAMRGARMLLPDDQGMLLLARLHGDAEAIQLRRASGNIQTLMVRVDNIAEAWEGLILIDPRYGPVSSGDRAEARRSAARIKAQLVGVQINAANLVDSARRLKLAPDPTGMRLIRDCDDLWATGQTVPDAT